MLQQATSPLDRHLKQLAIETVTPQVKKPIGVVPLQEYLDEMGYRRLGWRALRRNLVFMASCQAQHKIDSLKNAGKRGLWLYFGEGQMGDALMDLAPRSLLKAQGFQMDLLTDQPIARLFQNDPWFDSVTHDVSVLTEIPYDFAIVLSNKRRSIQHKRKYFKKLPWVSILENFSGPDFHRAGYATQRLSDLLGLELTPAEFSCHANQKLKPQLAARDFDAQASQVGNAIALCIGGVDPLRTFKDWTSVISALVRKGKHEFLLIGSDNGLEEAQKIEHIWGKLARVHNYVGKCSIQQSHDLLARAQLVVCADGGLMHLAATTTTPMLALLTSTIRPEWRIPCRPATTCVCSDTSNVNDIAATRIVEKICYLADKLVTK